MLANSVIVPIVVNSIFTILGLIVMYWCEKFILFNQCKRPIKGNNEINTAIHFLIFLGPLAYVVGSYLWTKQASNLLINMSNGLSLVLALVIVLLPYSEIVKRQERANKKQEIIRNSSYGQDIHLFSKEYYQLNPLESIMSTPKYRQFIREETKRHLQKMGESHSGKQQESRSKQHDDENDESSTPKKTIADRHKYIK